MRKRISSSEEAYEESKDNNNLYEIGLFNLNDSMIDFLDK